MITGKDFYLVLSAVVPMYFSMLLGYGSVKWWRIFTPDQCSGINRFVATFAAPLLSLNFVYNNNLYKMNYIFMAADTLQKVVILVVLFMWQAIRKSGMGWTITLFSLACLPNTLVVGIPLMEAMYGEFTGALMVQIVVFQSVIWNTLLLFLFEYRGGMQLMGDQFPETAAAISSIKVDSDVVSLSGREPLEASAEISDDGKLHVVLRRSNSSVWSSFDNIYGYGGNSSASVGPRASNLSGVEVYSVQSSVEPPPGSSSLNNIHMHATLAKNNKLSTSWKYRYPSSFQGGDVQEMQSSRSYPPRVGHSDEEEAMKIDKTNGHVPYYPPPSPVFSGSASVGASRKNKEGGAGAQVDKELHMFLWSSSLSSLSDHGSLQSHAVNHKASSTDFGAFDPSHLPRQHENEINDAPEVERQEPRNPQMPPATVMTKLILIMVWRKLIRNPNTYASLLGLLWSLIAFRWNIKMPVIVSGCVKILSNCGLGMAMFSLGLFASLQPKIIACGKRVALIAMAIKFFIGPLVMTATSAALGIRGKLLQVAIVQAALPLGIIPFIFAKEYNLHANIQSTTVIFGMFISLPVTIIYYVLLEL